MCPRYAKRGGRLRMMLAASVLAVCLMSMLPAGARPVLRREHLAEEEAWNVIKLPEQPAAAAAAAAAAARQRAVADPGLLWSECGDVPQFGTVCVGVYGDPTAVPATLGVELTVMNRTFLVPVVGAQACLDDASILAILAHDPKLRPLLKSLQVLIAAEKLLAAEAVSWCVSFTNTFVKRTEQGAVELGACPILEARIGCLAARCLYKHERDYRCFDVELPHRGSR